jgi:steroid 5-alpha reductase family enzyme
VSTLALSLATLGALSLLFLAVYGLARGIDNFGIVDIAWSYAFGAVAIVHALLGNGWFVRRALIGTMVLLWSMRLGTHLLIRIARKHPVEDGRYVQLRKDWEKGFAVKMGVFFQAQAVSVLALAVPFVLSCANPVEAVRPVEWAGALLWLLAISGEALADSQLSSFTGNPANKGKVCDSGLWRYSRHPNYFFEWLIWVSFSLFGMASHLGWIGLFSPACILYLLLRVTGIPATEEQSIRSKGDSYRAYQRTTSAFVPLPPRRASS